jgi:hypothetical protein
VKVRNVLQVDKLIRTCVCGLLLELETIAPGAASRPRRIYGLKIIRLLY